MENFFALKLKERRDYDSQTAKKSYVEDIFPFVFWRKNQAMVVPKLKEIAPEMPVVEKKVFADLPTIEIPNRLVQFRKYQDSVAKPIIVFVTDYLVADHGPNYERDDSIPVDLETAFLKTEALLFHKMILAMKLKACDYRVTATRLGPQSQREDYLEHAKQEVLQWAPQCVITLGAVALESFAPKQGKLSKLHGQFLGFDGLTLVPIFHPQFLLINQEMKKTAWADMQKVMELLGLK